MEKKKQVIVYVDGYNFYYGLKKGGARWKRHYWLDVVKFFERMMLPDQELVEVFTKRCDITIIVSADSDMIPSVEIIKGLDPKHPVHIFVPPTQNSYALASKCDHVVWLEHYKARFVQSMLPDKVTLANGHIVQRPDNWY